jgi:hypothetical protein
MTFKDKIKKVIQTANTKDDLMFDSMVEEVLPSVIEAVNEQALLLKYDGFTWDRPASEYPDMIYGMLFMTIKPVVLNYLKENHPEAWFLPMYMDKEEQDVFLSNKHEGAIIVDETKPCTLTEIEGTTITNKELEVVGELESKVENLGKSFDDYEESKRLREQKLKEEHEEKMRLQEERKVKAKQFEEEHKKRKLEERSKKKFLSQKNKHFKVEYRKGDYVVNGEVRKIVKRSA